MVDYDLLSEGVNTTVEMTTREVLTVLAVC